MHLELGLCGDILQLADVIFPGLCFLISLPFELHLELWHSQRWSIHIADSMVQMYILQARCSPAWSYCSMVSLCLSPVTGWGPGDLADILVFEQNYPTFIVFKAQNYTKNMPLSVYLPLPCEPRICSKPDMSSPICASRYPMINKMLWCGRFSATSWSCCIYKL